MHIVLVAALTSRRTMKSVKIDSAWTYEADAEQRVEWLRRDIRDFKLRYDAWIEKTVIDDVNPEENAQ